MARKRYLLDQRDGLPINRRRLLALAASSLSAGMPMADTWAAEDSRLGLRQGLMAGEVSESSVILQTRITDSGEDARVPWRRGFVRFEISLDPGFRKSRRTPVQSSEEATDGIVKQFVDRLKPGRTYYYRVLLSADGSKPMRSQAGRFRTLKGRASGGGNVFCVFSCLDYEQFFIKALEGASFYEGPDKSLGYPGLATMLGYDPDFVVSTGDAVYYDQIVRPWAKTADEMRQLWREQAVLPRMKALLSNVACYWQKDDHDYRFNDADPFMKGEPSPELAARIFNEQVPIVAAGGPTRTFRTHRISKFLQIWLTEGRDFRSPNAMPDGPSKSLWGEEQREWLLRTLLESDAQTLLVISPGPIVGPDFDTKDDNHTNTKGFRNEGLMFSEFLRDRNLTTRVTLICGDRHWPYHSISPEGVHEFCTGTVTEGAEEHQCPRPGDKISTDPEGKVTQPWIASKPTPSLLHVRTSEDGRTARFTLVTSRGELLYRFERGL